MTPSTPTPLSGAADPARFWRRSALGAAAVGLVAIGALASVAWQRSTPPDAMAPAVALADNSAGTTVAPPTGNRPSTQQSRQHAGTSADSRNAPQSSRTAPQTSQGSMPVADRAPAVAVCTQCGVVESVSTVTRKGEGSGIGAVAGGVLGGVVGNQMGGGNGRSALTVLGALGGGMAGNEIEKRQRATTEYRVSVRMDDGSLRSVTQSQSPTIGAPVRVENGQLVHNSNPVRQAEPRQQDTDVRTLQTSTRN